MIPYGRQDVTSEDIDAVVQVLQSDYLTQGPEVPAFEADVAKFVDVKHAVATNSATSALHLACLALGLGEGDWLWTVPNTFVASANCGLYCGANVDFVDIDVETYNLCPLALEKKLIQAKTENKLPKIVIPVHFAGQSCDMAKIHALSVEYGFSIIEDASHAIGGKYKEKPVGNCCFSDMTVFSFHPVKIITTGEGGMVTTNSDQLAGKVIELRSHGITRDVQKMTKEPDGDWFYQQVDLGFNYRMTDIQAALGRSQLKRLNSYIRKRHDLANSYHQRLADLPVKVPFQDPNTYSAYHLYPILLDLDRLQTNKRTIFKTLRDAGVGVNVHYIPVHTQPYYQAKGFGFGDCPTAEAYYARALTIPLFPAMTLEQQAEVVHQLKQCLI